jgi:NAD(P)-dependent dehydrogenase (short-subunit alcohol dehydrogenase family)
MTTCTRSHTLITGAGSGIGRATALHLAASGQHVYAGLRDPAESLDWQPDGQPDPQPQAGEITPVPLDITDGAQISAAVRTVAAHLGPGGLDGLVNNAGIGMFGPLELVGVDEFQRLLDVNVTGQLAITQAFLPLLRRSRGRVIFIGSIGSHFTLPFVGPTAASKSAVATLASALRQELAPWRVRVVLIEPASIRTEAVQRVEPDAERLMAQADAPARALYEPAFRAFLKVGLAREHSGSPPEVVAKTIAHALSAPRPRSRYLAGKDSRRMAVLASAVPVPLLDTLRRKVTRQPAPGSGLVATGQAPAHGALTLGGSKLEFIV